MGRGGLPRRGKKGKEGRKKEDFLIWLKREETLIGDRHHVGYENNGGANLNHVGFEENGDRCARWSRDHRPRSPERGVDDVPDGEGDVDMGQGRPLHVSVRPEDQSSTRASTMRQAADRRIIARRLNLTGGAAVDAQKWRRRRTDLRRGGDLGVA